MIPVMTPYDALCFGKYFSAVERILGLRFGLKYAPDEEHLTSTLCELFDEEGAKLHNLDYNLEKLNNDLRAVDSLLRADVKVETVKYNKYQESHLTQCDMGFIVEYTDRIDSSHDFTRGTLIQAKRLYPATNRTYSLNGTYGGYDSDQHDRLGILVEKYKEKCHHETFVHYLMYNPLIVKFTEKERERIRYKQIVDLRNHYGIPIEYFSNIMLGSEDRQIEFERQTEIAGLFVGFKDSKKYLKENPSGKTKYKAPVLNDVIQAVNIWTASMPNFLVRMMQGAEWSVGCSDPEVLRLVGGEKTDIASEIGIAPPRFVVKFSITAGTNSENTSSNQ